MPNSKGAINRALLHLCFLYLLHRGTAPGAMNCAPTVVMIVCMQMVIRHSSNVEPLLPFSGCCVTSVVKSLDGDTDIYMQGLLMSPCPYNLAQPQF